MITELNRLCSDRQNLGKSAVTAEASAYTLDNVKQERVYDGRLHFIVAVVNAADLAGGTSFQAVVQTSADNSTWAAVADTGTVTLANVKAAPYGILLDVTLNDNPAIKRYVRVAYTTVGTFTGDNGPIVTAGEFTEAAPFHKKSFA